MKFVFKLIFNIISLLLRFISSTLDQILASIPSLIRANAILNKKLQDGLVNGISKSDPRLKISEKELREYLDIDIKRLERIEDKAKSTVIGAALSIRDRKSTRLNSSHIQKSRMPSSA